MDNKKIIVVGGGHAGTEAAAAIARMGCKVTLVTHKKKSIGQMSCNPAIGGIGKSHLVKEVDALGGLMARATDMAGIHYRTLNLTKGQAVRATRAQTDRQLYKKAIQELLKQTKGLEIKEGSVEDLIIEGNKVKGVYLSGGEKVNSDKVILTTGTFLGGVMHVGLEQKQGGRAGDPSSNKLARKLRKLPFRYGRLKTGTPPRLDGRTIDFDQLESQFGDEPRPVFSYLGDHSMHPQQVCCYLTATNEMTHDIIRENLERSPIYGGAIEGTGPRYCPSVEDKVVRFAERTSHQIFVEPEGLDTPEIYPNGISTSLPFDVQWKLVQSIRGFERARITRPGYAIEYDYFPSSQLKCTLETKKINGLYFAGQMNGTSGYEEAAAQGLIAGANAGLKLLNNDPLVLGRDKAYIGVLIDDLITKDINEPYRMFTSSAEYRLSLRADNAAMRLTKNAFDLGLVKERQYTLFNTFNNSVSEIKHHCNKIKVNMDSKNIPLTDYLKRPENTIFNCNQGKFILEKYPYESIFTAETDIKYEGYVKIENARVNKLKKMETVKIPNLFDYSSLTNLSSESKEKLCRVKPETLGQASRIAGVRPSDIGVLAIFLKPTP